LLVKSLVLTNKYEISRKVSPVGFALFHPKRTNGYYWARNRYSLC